MKVLITGGAGFIGSNLAKKLSQMGYETYTLDIRPARETNQTTHILGDVADFQSIRKAVKGMDYVVHLVAITSPPEFLDPASQGYRVNVMGTYNVLAAALLEKAKRVVIASSSAVYGNTSRACSEDDFQISFDNLYPATKLINEVTARTFYSYGLDVVILRYFNVYGIENMKPNSASVIWRFIQDVLNNRQPIIYGDGTQSRDFIYIDDAVEATILAMERGRAGEIYNVGSGVSTSFNEIFRVIKELTNYNGEPLYVPIPYKSYQKFTLADMNKTFTELGFRPKFSIKDGINDILSKIS